MWLAVDCLHARVTRSTPTEDAWLRAYLSFPDHRAHFAGRKDGRVRMFDDLHGRFPAGLVPLVKRDAPLDGHQVQLLDTSCPVAPSPVVLGELDASLPTDPDGEVGWLRDDQREAVRRALARRRGLLHLPTGCLAADTTIEINRSGESYPIKLSDLVHRFNGGRITWAKRKKSAEQGRGMRWDPEIPTLVRSRDDEGFIRLHQLAVAMVSGPKTTFRVVTQAGRAIRATADHLFLACDGWAKVGDLSVGDRVFVDVGIIQDPKRAKVWYRIVNGVRRHPFAGRRNVNPSKGGWSVPLHRLVVEAGLNQMSVDKFVEILRVRAPNVPPLIFLDPAVWMVHHRDENPHNNDPSNLAVLTRGEHTRHHGREGGWKHVTSQTGLDRVDSIERIGEEPTFDLAMVGKPHNFLANGFVVHNSGKGELAVALARAVPTEWLFAVHRAGLAAEIAERFDRRDAERGWGLGPAGVIGEGRWVEGIRLTCATFQSLSRALKTGGKAAARATALLDRVGGIIADEAHTVAADTFWRVAMSTPRAAYRIGLSGTPLARGDRRSALTIAALGPVIYRLRADALVEEGLLSRPEIRMLAVTHPGCASPTYQGVYGSLVVRSAARNRRLVEAAGRATKPALLFVKEISHGKALEKALLRAGIPTGFVWGSHSTEWRRQAVKDLVAGRLEVLVCSVVFQEGVDIPALRSVIVGSAGRSVIASLQRIGRGMRVERDGAGNVVKDTFEVWDVQDRGHPWLERASNERRGAYAREGHSVVVEP